MLFSLSQLKAASLFLCYDQLVLLKFIWDLNNNSKKTKNHFESLAYLSPGERFWRLCVWALIQCWGCFPIISTLCCFKWHSRMRLLDKHEWDAFYVLFFFSSLLDKSNFKEGYKKGTKTGSFGVCLSALRDWSNHLFILPPFPPWHIHSVCVSL